MAMHANPSKQSASLVSCICLKTFTNVSKNPDVDTLSPSKLFNCDTAIITDVALVKPTVTGIEMKSTRTPEKELNCKMNPV